MHHALCTMRVCEYTWQQPYIHSATMETAIHSQRNHGNNHTFTAQGNLPCRSKPQLQQSPLLPRTGRA